MSLAAPARALPTVATSTLARDGGRNIAGAVLSNVCNFGIVILLARSLGNDAVGLYSVAFALRAMLVLISGFGMRVALTFFVASGRVRHEYAMVRGSMRLGLLLPLASSVLFGLVLVAGGHPIADHVFHKPQLGFLLVVVGISLPFAVLMDVALAATQGFQTMQAYARVGLVAEPVARVGLTVLALVLGFGLRGSVLALLGSSVVAAYLALMWLRRMTRPLPGSDFVTPVREMLSFASVSWVASMATQGLLWADILILGALVDADQVGVYQVATRVLLTAMIVITPLTTSMAPRIAARWAVGDRAGMTDRYCNVVRWSWRLSLPLIAGVVVVPAAALRAFGPDFPGGSEIVLILALGAVTESFAAPSAVLLNQIGRNKLNMVINMSALIANVALNLLLIPVWGIDGAAFAWAVALVVPGLVRVVAVRLIATDKMPFTTQHAVALGAAVVAGGLAWLAVQVPAIHSRWAAQLIVAALVVLLAYAMVVLTSGLDAGERAQVRNRRTLLIRRLTTIAPGLQTARNRWRLRRLEPGTETLEIRTLFSPFRYDILARVDLFQIAHSRRDLVDKHVDRFVDLVRTSRYRTWFDAVVIPAMGFEDEPPARRELAFEQNVRRSVNLMLSFERVGFDPKHPITVTKVVAGTEVDGRTLAEDRWMPLDGCHRLALLHLSGQTHLEPGQYLVDPDGRTLHNTDVVARAERLDRTRLVRFYAWGLVDNPKKRRVSTWEDLLDRVTDPANRAALARWPEASTLAATSPPGWYDVEDVVQTR